MSTTTDPHELLTSELRALGALSDLAEECIRQLPMRVTNVARGHAVLSDGTRAHECCLVLDGFFIRHTTVAGGRRRILSFHLPGDVPNLQSLHFPEKDLSLSTLTPGRVAFIPHAALRGSINKAPSLTDLFWRWSLADAAISRAWLATLGMRSAYQRVAHFFCETFVRLRALGLAGEAEFMLPLSQTELADALGLSVVHVNRTLQQLRREGIIVSHGRRHGFTDWGRLREAGDFDGGYLLQRNNWEPPRMEQAARGRPAGS